MPHRIVYWFIELIEIQSFSAISQAYSVDHDCKAYIIFRYIIISKDTNLRQSVIVVRFFLDMKA